MAGIVRRCLAAASAEAAPPATGHDKKAIIKPGSSGSFKWQEMSFVRHLVKAPLVLQHGGKGDQKAALSRATGQMGFVRPQRP